MSTKAPSAILRVLQAYERRCDSAPMALYWHFLEVHDALVHSFEVLITPFGVFVEVV